MLPYLGDATFCLHLMWIFSKVFQSLSNEEIRQQYCNNPLAKLNVALGVVFIMHRTIRRLDPDLLELICSLGLLLVFFGPSRVFILATLGTLVAARLVVVGHDVHARLGLVGLGRGLRRLAVASSSLHRPRRVGYQKQKAQCQTCFVHGENVSRVLAGSRRIPGDS